MSLLWAPQPRRILTPCSVIRWVADRLLWLSRRDTVSIIEKAFTKSFSLHLWGRDGIALIVIVGFVSYSGADFLLGIGESFMWVVFLEIFVLHFAEDIISSRSLRSFVLCTVFFSDFRRDDLYVECECHMNLLWGRCNLCGEISEVFVKFTCVCLFGVFECDFGDCREERRKERHYLCNKFECHLLQEMRSLHRNW